MSLSIINKQLQQCKSYIVGNDETFRIPSQRLCPMCNGMVNILGSREHCKHVDNCPTCGNGFCMSCLKTKVHGLWPCGDTGFDRCRVAPRQQLGSDGNITFLKEV